MAKDQFTREWIIENAVDICSRYNHGELTLRALHYLLVSRGMTNTLQHYKRVVQAMEGARWDNLIPFEQFSDHDRAMLGETDIEEVTLEDAIEQGKDNVKAWMRHYYRNKWENQRYYVEVFIEKKALQGIFEPITASEQVGLGACKGYPSLTFLNDTYKRFQDAADAGKELVIIYFGDYDPSGMDIPNSIKANLERFGVDVEIDRVALNHEQVVAWKLPYAPVKEGDSRTANFTGLGQVELDAIEPRRLQSMCRQAIAKYFDTDLYAALKEQEKTERVEYQKALRDYVINMEFDD